MILLMVRYVHIMIMVVFFISVVCCIWSGDGVALDQMCGRWFSPSEATHPLKNLYQKLCIPHFSNRDFVRDNLSNHFVPQPILAYNSK